MDIRSTIAGNLSRRIRDYGKPMCEFAADFDIPLTSLKSYVKGDANLRADTIDLLAEKLGIPPAALISTPLPAWERAQAVFAAADTFARWPQERQERMLSLFLELVQVFSEENPYLPT